MSRGRMKDQGLESTTRHVEKALVDEVMWDFSAHVSAEPRQLASLLLEKPPLAGANQSDSVVGPT